MTEEEKQQLEELKSKVEELSNKIENTKDVSNPGNLIDWPTSALRVKKLEVVSKGNSLYGVRSDDGYYIGVGDQAVNIITSGKVIQNINSVAQNWNPNQDDAYALGSSASFRWSDIKVVKINGSTPLAGTKVYYVADSSGGAVTRKLTFTDGILTAEV